MQKGWLNRQIGCGVLAAAMVAGSSASADFDLKLTCVVTKGPTNAPFVPKEVVIEIDIARERVRLTDEIIAEMSNGWHKVDATPPEGGIVRFAYSFLPNISRYRKDSWNSAKTKVRYSYRLDLNTNTFRANIRSGSNLGHLERAEGTCRQTA
jgi:hypothetical protein